MKKWGKALREKEMQIAIEQRKNPETVVVSGFSGAISFLVAQHVMRDQFRYTLKIGKIES